jgi:hypothetical protein
MKTPRKRRRKPAIDSSPPSTSASATSADSPNTSVASDDDSDQFTPVKRLSKCFNMVVDIKSSIFYLERNGKVLKKSSPKTVAHNPALGREIAAMGLDATDKWKQLMELKREGNTKEAYLSHYGMLWSYLEGINDIRSMVMLLDEAPKRTYPINPKSLLSYMSCRLGKPGDPLIVDGVRITGRNGLMQCTGGWKAPVSFTQFASAISTLHKQRGQDGPYRGVCSQCLNLKNGGDDKGCDAHRYKPQLVPSGNPTDCLEFREHMKSLLDQLAGHRPAGASFMTPWQLMGLCQTLANRNTIWSLQVYVMVLLGVSLHLREDELSQLKFEDIIPRHSMMSVTGTVEYLCIQVYGKRDDRYIKLVLWRNRVNRFLCPVNALLWWLNLSNIRSGFLFKPKSFKIGVAIDDTEVVEYVELFGELQKTLSSMLPNMKWGTHTLRKTSILLDTWAGACDTDIAQAARIGLPTVQIYRQDAATLREMAISNNYAFKYLVDDFRAQNLTNIQQSAEINASSSAVQINQFLSSWLRKNPMALSESGIAAFAQNLLRSNHIQADYRNSLTQLKSILDGSDHTGLENAVTEVLETMTAAKTFGLVGKEPIQIPRRMLLFNTSTVDEVDQEEEELDPKEDAAVDDVKVVPTANVVNPASSLSESNGKYDCPARKTAMEKFAASSGEDRLQCLLELTVSEPVLLLAIKKDVKMARFTGACQTFIKQTLAPILACFETCCNKDKKVFVEKHGARFIAKTFKGGCDC